MDIKIVRDKISQEELLKMAKEAFGDMVKAVVDAEKGIMAIGGELHADAEALLLEQGSNQEDLWGINIYPEKSGDDLIEYSSLINIRPRLGNRSMEVGNSNIRDKIKEIINKLVNGVE